MKEKPPEAFGFVKVVAARLNHATRNDAVETKPAGTSLLMKTLFSVSLAALSLVVAGCSSPRSTSLLIRAPAGTPFTVQYKAGALSGTASSTTRADGATQVFEITLRETEFECTVSKGDPSANLSAEIEQGGQAVYRAEAPAGTQGVRIRHGIGGWQQERY